MYLNHMKYAPENDLTVFTIAGLYHHCSLADYNLVMLLQSITHS